MSCFSSLISLKHPNSVSYSIIEKSHHLQSTYISLPEFVSMIKINIQYNLFMTQKYHPHYSIIPQ